MPLWHKKQKQNKKKLSFVSHKRSYHKGIFCSSTRRLFGEGHLEWQIFFTMVKKQDVCIALAFLKISTPQRKGTAPTEQWLFFSLTEYVHLKKIYKILFLNHPRHCRNNRAKYTTGHTAQSMLRTAALFGKRKNYDTFLPLSSTATTAPWSIHDHKPP